MDMFLAWLPWLVIGAAFLGYLMWDGSATQIRRRERRSSRPTRSSDDHTRHERGWGTQGWDDDA